MKNVLLWGPSGTIAGVSDDKTTAYADVLVEAVWTASNGNVERFGFVIHERNAFPADRMMYCTA